MTTNQTLLLNFLQTSSIFDQLAIMGTMRQRKYRPPTRNDVKSSWQRRRPAQKPFPFFKLPLELRIMVYDHAISDQEHNITLPRRFRRSTALLYTNLQITREIYQFCPITAIIDLPAPVHGIHSRDNRYISFSYYGDKTIRRMELANKAVGKFWSVDYRRQLTLRVRVKCMECETACKGLGGNEVCGECEMFVQCKSWTSGTSKNQNLITEDRMFEFCWARSNGFWVQFYRGWWMSLVEEILLKINRSISLLIIWYFTHDWNSSSASPLLNSHLCRR